MDDVWCSSFARRICLALAGLGLIVAHPSLAKPTYSSTVTVIDREELLRSGATSVAEYLRATPFNSFGSFRPQSSSTAQSWAELSLRGLGGRHSLILIDGRRAPIAPSVGFGHDLNAIPLAAVERIEISTGVTAIHGSDAAGGVVNIVTRQKYSGVELSVGAGRPTAKGGETEEGSVLFGHSSDRGSVVVGASYANRGLVYDRDREWHRPGISTFSNNFINSSPAAGILGFNPASFAASPVYGSVVPGGCQDPDIPSPARARLRAAATTSPSTLRKKSRSGRARCSCAVTMGSALTGPYI